MFDSQVAIKCFKKEDRSNPQMLDNESIVNETDCFLILIETRQEIVDVETYRLLLTDIPFKIELIRGNTGHYIYGIGNQSLENYFRGEGFSLHIYSEKHIEIDDERYTFYKLFINYPSGRCNISLVQEDDFDTIIANHEVQITSKKLQEAEFKNIVSYLYDKSANVWEGRSLLENQAIDSSQINRELWRLHECERFENEFTKEHLPFFSFDAITRIVKSNYLTHYSTDTDISDESLYWLTNNLDTLTPTVSHDVHKIKIRNRLFRPSEMLANRLSESTDVTENRFIKGFIKELIFFCAEIEKSFFTKKSSVPHPRRFKEEIAYLFYNRIEKKASKVKRNLIKALHKLTALIPTSTEINYVDDIQKIASKPHYYFIYQFYIGWVKHRNAQYKKESLPFLGIDRMDVLFERACYFKLVDAFTELGFQAKTKEKSYSEKKKLFQIVEFTKKGEKYTLHYEVIPSEITTVTSGGQLRPDFIIKLTDNSYVIIDAKYKSLSNIRKCDLPELSLKYLHGLGLETGGKMNTVGLFTMYPSTMSEKDFYQNSQYDLFSPKRTLPSIGSIGTCFSNSNDELKNILEILLNISGERHLT
jgi:hypothetical protein